VATEQKEEATRGAILQRHKLEYKKVRDEIAKMKENKYVFLSDSTWLPVEEIMGGRGAK
jgi:hypothetical protein